jgi:16S rRNA (adenine1518-N6/adenine1519-N6)-dimethyltransferase
MADHSRPTGQRDPDALIRRAEVRGDPNQDQHFLIDDRVVDRLTEYLPRNASTAHILEVGGGTGVLTDRLLTVADQVTVIERDPTLVSFLRDEFSAECRDDLLTVIEGDALALSLPDFTASISNLPYGISSEITFRLLPAGRPLILMFQREFAERMAAAPGTDEYGRLSVTAGHYADIDIVEPVPKEAFDPIPAVESSVVRCVPRNPEYETPDVELFLDFVTGCFTQRRKTMRNAIRNTGHITGLSAPDRLVNAADESLLGKRAGEVTPPEFAELTVIADEVGAWE